jgi:chromosome segregation ATPase
VAGWNASDGKRFGQMDANPAPLAEQLVAAEKRVQDLQARGNKPPPNLIAAEAEVSKAASELESATKSLESAKADQTAKEAEVVRLKEVAAKARPPADIDAKLAEAREIRGKARSETTNRIEAVSRKAEELKLAKDKLIQVQKENPAELIEQTKALIAKLKAAQVRANVVRAQENLFEKKQEHDRLTALTAEKQDLIQQLNQQLASADSASKSKVKASLKAAAAEARAAASALKKCANEIAAEQERVNKLTADYQKNKTASISSAYQTRL